MNDFLTAQLTEHIQMVQRGCKPASMLQYQERYHADVTNMVRKAGLFYKATLSDHKWGVIIIYKNPRLSLVINELPKEPKTPAEHYLLGALFGYDTDSICNYIIKNLAENG